MSRIDDMYGANPDAAGFTRAYFERLSELLREIDADAVARFVDALLDARERGARVFFMGNGGSAATASHWVNDLVIGTRSFDKPFKAVSLTDNTAVVTAIANDHGYDTIFVRQLQAELVEGDMVVAISASGNSPNVVQAVEWAKENGALTAAMTGFDGGRLHQIADIVVHAPSDKGEYGPVEDVHMILDHVVGAFLTNVCAAEQRV